MRRGQHETASRSTRRRRTRAGCGARASRSSTSPTTTPRDFGPVGESADACGASSRSSAAHGTAGRDRRQNVHGIRVAVIGFAPYPWAQSLTDISAAKRLVRQARARADVVVVTMHAGAEGVSHSHVTAGTETFLGENRGNSLAFAHAVVQRRRGSRRRLGPARAARDRVVPRPADRLLARELRRLRCVRRWSGRSPRRQSCGSASW